MQETRTALFTLMDGRDVPPRILLTGARGQVGIRAMHHWLAAGAEVVALTRKVPPENLQPALTWVTGDLANPESLAAIPEPFPPVVVFTAPIWFLPLLMEMFARKGVTRIVAFSSTSVHSKKTSGKAMERELAARLAESERVVLDASGRHGIATTILRPTLIYGIGIDQNVTSIARIMRKLPLFPVPLAADGLRQPVHADDLALATLQVASAPATYGNTYDMGGAERIPYRVFLQRIASALGTRVLLVPIPAFALMLDVAGKLLGTPQRIHGEIARRMQQDMVFDDSAARADFNWRPRGFLDASRQPEGVGFFG